MLIDQKGTHQAVRRIVFKLTGDRALHEDLTQEAIIHLWLRETEHPGQTRSWYFQSCRFYLQNRLRTGRSVDAARRQAVLCSLIEAYECPGTSADDSACGGSVRALVSAREAARLLTPWLTPAEQRVLRMLEEGYGVRAIAAVLDISHTSVVRYRRRIADLARRLGMQPLLNRSNARNDGRRMKITIRLQKLSLSLERARRAQVP